ncbi:hypothetical protein CHS0354_003971 [Potamilus streckersoni]|uniref:Uncharacterized protein n=1 Tax=Potamilus streckersoni TaxID=2493646 RepID=A0AAE0W8T2_9BIVA|nr:hypothetical protein CHS0354_003971 [Potamilus streckersoni]
MYRHVQTCVSRIWITTVTVAEGKLHYARRFAVDYSTGNIYCTAYVCMDVYRTSVNHVDLLSPNGKYRILVRGLDEPEGMVVYPSKGKVDGLLPL